MRVGDYGHLTYCTNIHPGETWPEVRANLERFLPAVKRKVAAGRELGVGLRLSAVAADALRDRATLEELRDFLHRQGLYVFTVNAFPFGPFHGRRVKEEVYLPDWRDEERLRYSDVAAEVLAELLPDDAQVEGSISTVPGAFKPNARLPDSVERMTELMIRHAAWLWRLRRDRGRTISLALEPEPACFLETIEESVAFFQDHLFSRPAVTRMTALTGLKRGAAEEALRRHLGLCYDLCHGAVEFEDVAGSIERLKRAGIRISKVQVTAGLRFPRVDRHVRDLLQAFDDAVYLHQVVERGPGGLVRYVDLPQAFEALATARGEREWRVHFHVPVFLADLGPFSSTQDFVAAMLDRHRAEPISDHLEVETYTWNVLPERYRAGDVVDAIGRELDWVVRRLEA
jgi:sugar phosphate isomerase/epimerase